MKKGKVLTLIVIVLLSIFGLTYFFIFRDKKTSLTLSQKKWIENNKNNVIDFAVPNNVSIINENGRGLIFDFLKSLEKDTGLEFNTISYDIGKDVTSEYALVQNDGLSLYKDEYVIVTKDNVYYNKPSELINLKIGSVKDEISDVSSYLEGSININYVTFENSQTMFEAIKNKEIDGAIVSKLDYLSKIVENKLNIAYSIDEYYKDYTIKLGSNDELNKIVKQYFEVYKKDKYKNSLSKHISDTYFKLNKIDENKQADFRSKRYNYGFVLNAPYEVNINGSLKGFNISFIKEFADMANIDVSFKRYSSNLNMLNDFNKNDLDIIYGDVSLKFNSDVYRTGALYDNTISIISKGNTLFEVNNLSSFKDQEVLCIKDSNEAKYLKKYGANVVEYDNLYEVVNHLKGDKICAIDSYSYDYYSRSILKDAFNIETIDIDKDYSFISRDTSDNKIFNSFLNFYLSFIDKEQIINNSYKEIISSNNSIIILETVLGILLFIFVIITLIFMIRIVKRRKKYDVRLSKADKLRYIDSLTSLKNRNYLNDNISKWDDSKVYPQSVIIIDLNNIAYINDNFGHGEGDKVISEGSSVLINNQLSDSEIIRTNGNEFLVFTIGHDEREIITYIRKINKGLRELSHGFGAAIGYSMISDEIKTVDDAINEATIDMRNNKADKS